jgi:cupin fold WbuC family metalloprotein
MGALYTPQVPFTLLLEEEPAALKKKSRASSNGVAHKLIRNSEKEQSPPGILCSAIQPMAYIQPHRHPNAEETYYFHSGLYAVVLFTDEGTIERFAMFPASSSSRDRPISFQIPQKVWHTVLAREESILYSVYHGVYNSNKQEEYKELPLWTPSNDRQATYVEDLWKRIQHR